MRSRSRAPRPVVSAQFHLDPLERRTLLSAVVVTSADDAGAGTFRAAVEQANGDPSVDAIRFAPGVGTVTLADTVVFTGGQDLSISGSHKGNAIIEASGDFDVFATTGGGDLSLSALTVRGGQDGVVVQTPAGATGTVRVSLRDVAITDNAEFGLRIDDLTNATAASIDLTLTQASILRNGTAVHDRDGVRVDEGGAGDVTARIQNSNLDANGAEGIELDESGAGDVRLDVRNSTFNRNGYVANADGEDFDDGIDVDEADAGDVIVSIRASEVNGNFDEGVDLNESGAGSLFLSASALVANKNVDEGVALEEAGAGNLSADLRSVRLVGNTADGFQAEEAGGGDLLVDIAGSVITGNTGDGVKVEQDGDGTGLLTLRGSSVEGNGKDAIDADGVVVRQVGGH